MMGKIKSKINALRQMLDLRKSNDYELDEQMEEIKSHVNEFRDEDK